MAFDVHVLFWTGGIPLRRFVIILAALIVLAPAAALADDIVSTTPGAGLQPFPSPWPTGTGVPYWNQPSADGANLNIGHILTGPSGPGALPWWGVGNNADPNFYFNKTSSQATATILIEIAGYKNINIFGWYDITNPANNGIIFPGPGSAGNSVVVNIPVGNYGFFLQVGPNGPIYYTQSILNPNGDQTHQHFAAFLQGGANGPVYWIGIEDLKLGSSGLNSEGMIGDYNDMVLKITPISVPEPGTIALFGAGLLGLAIARRKFRS